MGTGNLDKDLEPVAKGEGEREGEGEVRSTCCAAQQAAGPMQQYMYLQAV